jgi:hypothetical protein
MRTRGKNNMMHWAVKSFLLACVISCYVADHTESKAADTKSKAAPESRDADEAPSSSVKPSDATPSMDAVTVDEEIQSPEGHAFVTSCVYERRGDAYKSTSRSISRALVEKIRQAAFDSQTKAKPDLKDFGITQESVLKNRGVMLDSAYSEFLGKIQQHPPFDKVSPELKRLFSYEVVAKNALTEITGAMNSAYDCVRISLPGDPTIILMSHHRQSGMLPWMVKVGDRTWRTYSRDLPKLLAEVVSPMSRNLLETDEPDHRYQDMSVGRRQTSGYWPNGFFSGYGHWAREKRESIDGIEAAMQIPGWAEASRVVTIEDALEADHRGRSHDQVFANKSMSWMAITVGLPGSNNKFVSAR